MIFDLASENVILISYPSGGFGNFLYYILSEFADQTIKISSNKLSFNELGDSHNAIKYTNTYFMDPIAYQPTIDLDPKNNKILVLCDNGINNDQYNKLKPTFPNAKIIRTVIDLAVRPIVYQTCIIKAMRQNFNTEHATHIKNNWVDAIEDYAQRENFTLLYHNWSFGWGHDESVINVSLEKLILNPFNTIKDLISKLDMQLINENQLKTVLAEWYTANKKYFDVYFHSKLILTALKNKENIDISYITDLHEQGYINYCVEKEYNIIIPVYDYRDWFQSTKQLQEAINNINEENLISS